MTLENYSKNGKKLTLMNDLPLRDVNLILQEVLTTSENDSIKGKALIQANEVHLLYDNYPPEKQTIPYSNSYWDYALENGQKSHYFFILCRE